LTRIELAPEVAGDLDRIFDHLTRHDAQNVADRIREIVDAISVLEGSPMIGRPAGAGLRELIVGNRRSGGYIALYRHVAAIDTVFVLAVRSQREAGYARD
jgi:plasmid stabilization system protein ParE